MSTTLCIVSTGVLESRTARGGGVQEIDYRLALQLSKNDCIDVLILSPFYRKFKGRYYVEKHFIIDEVYVPSVKNYPLQSTFEKVMMDLTVMVYSILVVLKLVRLKKMGMKLIILDYEISGLVPGIIGRVLGAKVLFSEGNLLPWSWPFLFTSRMSVLKSFSRAYHLVFGKLVCRLSDHIRVQNRAVMENMVRQGMLRSKITLIEGGVDTDFFSPHAHDTNERLRVGFLGALDEIKGAPLLLEVVKESANALPNVTFTIIGGGPYKRFLKDMRNVEWLGPVERPKLPQHLQNVDVMLFFQKDLGLAELESMAAGKTIIAAKVGDVPEYITHMKDCLLCDLNSRAYVEAIRLLDEDRQLLETLSETARQTAAYCFSWRVIGKKWSNLISSLIES